MRLGDPYQIVGVLGSGGFGTVYRARFRGEGGFSKEVALKVLNPHLEGSGEFAARLRDEARMLGLLRHRAIVTVDRLLRTDDRWIIAMEYVEGLDLAEVLKSGPVPVGPALEIAAEVAGALHAAWHRPGGEGSSLHLLHRDIKPANLMLTALGEVKILDFGIARAEFDGREGVSKELTFGSVNYVAPERMAAAAGGPASDVYALGAVLYEMVCGRPFGRTLPDPEWHASHLQTALDTLRASSAGDDEVVQLLAAALAFDPAARPTAADLEARALAIRPRTGGELLRYWAERALGPRIAERAAAMATAEPTMEGPELEIRPATEPTPAGAAGPARRAWVLPAGVGLTLVAGGLGWYLASAPAREDPTPTATAAPVAATGGSAVASPPLLAPPSDPAAAPRASPASTTLARDASRPGTPRSVAPPPPHATVTLTGDAQGVSLRGTSGTYALPGEVPPGEYQILATLSGSVPIGAGTLRVADGEAVALRCSASFGKCAVQARTAP